MARVGERLDVARTVDEGAPGLRIGVAVAGPIEREETNAGRDRPGNEQPRAGRAVEQQHCVAVAVAVLVDGERAPVGELHSWTSSISVPNAVFGCTNATVVPRLPGRGCSSITRYPCCFTESSAFSQSATR